MDTPFDWKLNLAWIDTFEYLMRPDKPTMKDFGSECYMQNGLLEMMTRMLRHLEDSNWRDPGADFLLEKSILQKAIDLQTKLLRRLKDNRNLLVESGLLKIYNSVWTANLINPELKFNTREEVNHFVSKIKADPTTANHLEVLSLPRMDEGSIKSSVEILGRIPQRNNDRFKCRTKTAAIALLIYIKNSENIAKKFEVPKDIWETEESFVGDVKRFPKNTRSLAAKKLEELASEDQFGKPKLWQPHLDMASFAFSDDIGKKSNGLQKLEDFWKKISSKTQKVQD